jgi:murein DD-endopeptidase MepM/ murein hydrolase activator NlpD
MAVQQVQNLPAQFVQDLGQDLAKQIVAQSGTPVVAPGSGGITQLAGETAADFQARQKAAQQFDVRQQSLAGLAPQVAAQDALQTQAQTLAQQGIGSYQPFVQAAQAATGPQAYQEFMSPYQQQVIDTTLSEFDRQAQAQEQRIRDQAVASGAFGGGREGVALAEYGAASDRNRAALQAGLLQQGFGQAQQAAQQQFQNQMGLASILPGLQRQDVSQLGTLGALNQAQAQAGLDAQREAARQAAFLPSQELDRYAAQVTGLMGGYPGQTQTTVTPNPTPLQTALGVGTTLAGIYGAIKNPGGTTFNLPGFS